MFDGKRGTMWGTRSNFGGVYDWVNFNLRERYLIKKVRINYYDSYGPNNINLQFSNGSLSHTLSRGQSGAYNKGKWEDILIKSNIVSDYLKLTVENKYFNTDTFLDEIELVGCPLDTRR